MDNETRAVILSALDGSIESYRSYLHSLAPWSFIARRCIKAKIEAYESARRYVMTAESVVQQNREMTERLKFLNSLSGIIGVR